MSPGQEPEAAPGNTRGAPSHKLQGPVEPGQDRLETGEGAKTPLAADLGDTVRDEFTSE